jgi:hypothetical protein
MVSCLRSHSPGSPSQFEQQLALKSSAFEQMRTVEAAAADRAAKLEEAEAIAHRALLSEEARAAETDTKEAMPLPRSSWPCGLSHFFVWASCWSGFGLSKNGSEQWLLH